MTREDMLSDLSFVREMAERGRTAPLLGGRFGLMWGALTGAALFWQWLVLTGRAGPGPQSLMWSWLAYGVTGSLGTFLLDRSLRGAPGASSVNNRLASIVWGSLGILIGLYAVGVFLGVAFGSAPLAAFDTILGVAFAGYAVANYAVGRFSNDKVILGFGGLSALTALVVGALIGQMVIYLVAAASVTVIGCGSGLYQISREPRGTV